MSAVSASTFAARHLTVVGPRGRAAAREEALSKARRARRQLEGRPAERKTDSFAYLRRAYD